MAAVIVRNALPSLTKLLSARSSNVKSPVCIYYAARSMAAWNKDWKPGPYPKTPEEREKAARKYGLIPEDYEPYPDDGSTTYGDYPKLEPVSGEARDPYESWDFPVWRKNYGEPLHVAADILGETRYNINAKPKIPTHIQWFTLIGFLSLMAGLYVFADQYKIHKPVMPKQYPKAGEVHYTFEPAS